MIQLKHTTFNNYKKKIIKGLREHGSKYISFDNDFVYLLVKKVEKARSYNQIYHAFDDTIFDSKNFKIRTLIEILKNFGVKIKE